MPCSFLMSWIQMTKRTLVSVTTTLYKPHTLKKNTLYVKYLASQTMLCMIWRKFQCLIHKTHLWKLPRTGMQGTALLTFNFSYTKAVGQDSSVGIVTHYRLDGLGIKPWWGKIFCTRPYRPWRPPSLLYKGYHAFPGVKRPGSGVDHPPPSSAEVKKRLELYLYSPSGPLWPILGWTLPSDLPVQQGLVSCLFKFFLFNALCHLISLFNLCPASHVWINPLWPIYFHLFKSCFQGISTLPTLLCYIQQNEETHNNQYQILHKI